MGPKIYPADNPLDPWANVGRIIARDNDSVNRFIEGAVRFPVTIWAPDWQLRHRTGVGQQSKTGIEARDDSL